MNTKKPSVAKRKSQLQVVISNLRKLESANSKAIDSLQENETRALMLETSALLGSLETAASTNMTKIIEKRKRKRRNAKIRRKLIHGKLENISANAHTTKSKVIKKESEKIYHKPAVPVTTSQKSHQQLRSYHDANRFLKTFELLELLHMARVNDDESTRLFSEKLNTLRSIWNVIRLENVPEKTTAKEEIQNEWKTLLFGVQERSYYKREKNFDELINVRRTWDSYISREPNVGSSIPQGFVLPRDNVHPLWARYRTE